MQKPYMLCIGHRGAMGHEPENTLASIRKALALGAPCIEIDVYHVDNHLVVFHDEQLERTTDGHGYIAEQSFDYLRSLDAGKGQTIPTLEEVCEVINAQACLNIELKEPGTAVPVTRLIGNLVNNGWTIDQFLVSSFNHRELAQVQHLNKDIKLGIITNQQIDASQFAGQPGVFSIHISMDAIDQQVIKDAHSRGLKVFAYTVNHLEDITRMQQLGVDGVFSNYPERVLERYSQGDRSRCWN